MTREEAQDAVADPIDRPVAFTTPLVRDVMAGRKTQTRRPMKIDHKPDGIDFHQGRAVPFDWYGGVRAQVGPSICPPLGLPGDLLYVRESATVDSFEADRKLLLCYDADLGRRLVEWPERIKRPTEGHRLADGAYREACRLWLRVASVRVERLHSITEDDACAEGFDSVEAFAKAWDGFYGSGPHRWGADPWVWVHDFEVVSTTGRPA